MVLDKLIWWLSLSSEEAIGPSSLVKIRDLIKSPELVYQMDGQTLKTQFEFLKPKTIASILKGPKRNYAENQIQIARFSKVEILCWDDPDYPESLKFLKDSPAILFVKGTWPQKVPLIAIVGTRSPTVDGQKITRFISRGLVEQGYGIISGLALGIDGAAHRACVDRAGKTIAVLGSGLDDIGPKSNLSLANDILKSGGAIITEFAFQSKYHPRNFPVRNRIISALSLGVLMTEGDLNSGALITCDYAEEHCIPVFAVPGSPFSTKSKGTNLLLEHGAVFTIHSRSIYNYLNSDSKVHENKTKTLCIKSIRIKKKQKAKTKEKELLRPLLPEQKKIFNLITEDLNIEELSEVSSTPSYRLIPILLQLELAGLIEKRPGSIFSKKVNYEFEEI